MNISEKNENKVSVYRLITFKASNTLNSVNNCYDNCDISKWAKIV